MIHAANIAAQHLLATLVMLDRAFHNNIFPNFEAIVDERNALMRNLFIGIFILMTAQSDSNRLIKQMTSARFTNLEGTEDPLERTLILLLLIVPSPGLICEFKATQAAVV